MLLLLLLQLPLQRTTGHYVLGVAHSHVHLRPQVGWQVTGEQGSTGRLVELTDLPLHHSIGLMLRRVGEGVDDPLPLTELLQ